MANVIQAQLVEIKIQRLTDMLNFKRSEAGLDDTDPEWYLFLRDHRNQILYNSKSVFLNESIKGQYEYHLRWFLEDQQISPDLLWIIMYLNNIKMESEFVQKDMLIIPDRDQIIELRRQFRQFKRKLEEANYTL